MRHTLAILALLALGACQQPRKAEEAANAPAGGKTPTACTLDPFGCRFMPIAGCAGIFEVEAGKVAARRATSPAVKAYAELMVKEHGAINDEYRELMRRKGMVPPDTTLLVYRQKLDTLLKLPAEQFDARYARMMVDDHTMAVQMFKQAAQTAQDAEYQEWLGRMQTIVAQHAQHATELQQGQAHPHHGAGAGSR